MQRVHEDDLAGKLLGADGWSHLNLPAIATRDELITTGGGQLHSRREGDVLHPAREPLNILMALKAGMGGALFSAQYQQETVPVGGNMVQMAWFGRHEQDPAKAQGDLVVQSWDCASKDNPLNDYSVCITALIRGRTAFILDVFRRRLNFPDLWRKAIDLGRTWEVDIMLIEDAASGTQLLQTLKVDEVQGLPSPISVRPDGDKVSRFSGATGMIESGDVSLPEDAGWMAEFEIELLAFPLGRHDTTPKLLCARPPSTLLRALSGQRRRGRTCPGDLRTLSRGRFSS